MQRSEVIITKRTTRAFTLVELLVVIAVTGLLTSILLPSLRAAKAQAQKVICRTNLHQLALANLAYAAQHREYFVPAAEDMNHPDPAQRNLTRWHGKRRRLQEPFTAQWGPLASYLDEGKVRQCPQRVDFVKGESYSMNYEDGAGGYGYNVTYLGSRSWDAACWGYDADRRTTRTTEVKSPAATLMFADCAMGRLDGAGNPYFIETSFAWQVHVIFSGTVMDGRGEMPAIYQSPTIHFRHDGQANIAWADGHVDSRLPAVFKEENAFGADSAAMGLGWFDPLDNSLFDLR